MARDGISSAENALADIERQGSVSMVKATNNAKAAAEAEHKMTLLQGIRTYPKAIAWSVLISTCIAMEGYDISLVNNFYAFPQFTKKYGELTSNGSYQVPAAVCRASRYSLFLLFPTPHFLPCGIFNGISFRHTRYVTNAYLAYSGRLVSATAPTAEKSLASLSTDGLRNDSGTAIQL